MVLPEITLRSLGDPPPIRALRELLTPSTDPDELTAQEERVARAVARGATNREVAAELFLSPKTIEFHLGRVYRKLGIKSRTELAAAAAEGRLRHGVQEPAGDPGPEHAGDKRR